MQIDTSELDRLAADLGRIPAKVAKGIAPIVRKGALNVKNDWNDSFRESESFKGIAGSVNFETKVSGDGHEAEIGPDKGKHPGLSGPPRSRPAAPLANIAHFGGARGGGTVEDPQKHLDAEAPRFVKALTDLIGDAL